MASFDSQPIVISFLKPLQGANDLADERVVELLVRGYVDRCLAAFRDAAEGRVSQDDAVDDIYQLASALNAVFLGTSGFHTLTVHPWNAAGQLGVFLRDTLDLDFPPGECVRASLVHLATQIMLGVQQPQPEWEGMVEQLTIDMRDLLLGRAPDDDGEALPYA